MSRAGSTRADAATAGLSVVGSMVVLGLIGYGIGSIAGVAVPVGLAGLFVGVFAGLWVVHARFRRI